MRKKKIVVTHAQVPFGMGGAELHVQNLTAQLRKHGFDAELVQLPYKWYPPESLYDNLLMWRLLDLKEINEEKIDLVIGTKFPSYGLEHPNKIAWVIHQFRQAYDLYDSPYGLAHAENGAQIREIVANYDAKVLKECRNLFANSKTVAARMKKYNDLDAQALYHPPALAGRYACHAFENYILSVGRLDKLKRNDLLIRALAYCDQKITLKIAGRGSEQKPLEKLAKSLGVSDRVQFLGFVKDEDLIDLYANARMVYYAPVDEDYGYITLEAFLSGKPVLTCQDAGGVLEFVKEDATGFVCEPDAKAVGACIDKNFEQVSRLRELGQEGYQKVKKISWEYVVGRLTEGL